jgi:hypothetical protein
MVCVDSSVASIASVSVLVVVLLLLSGTRGKPANASGAVRADRSGEKVEKKRLKPSSVDAVLDTDLRALLPSVLPPCSSSSAFASVFEVPPALRRLDSGDSWRSALCSFSNRDVIRPPALCLDTSGDAACPYLCVGPGLPLAVARLDTIDEESSLGFLPVRVRVGETGSAGVDFGVVVLSDPGLFVPSFAVLVSAVAGSAVAVAVDLVAACVGALMMLASCLCSFSRSARMRSACTQISLAAFHFVPSSCRM